MRETKTHLEPALERELERIRGKVSEMAELAEKALRTCVRAVIERDRQLAYSVILRDQYIDEREKELDRLCLEFLVRRQPTAGLLRFACAAIKISLELERVGDYAESIARQTLKLGNLEIKSLAERLQSIAGLSIPMLGDAIRAFLTEDAALAKEAMETEAAVDVAKRSLNKEWVRLFQEDKLPFEALNPLMMVSRRFERVSDQARNICLEVLQMCTGENVKHPGSDGFRILFVDDHNACGSQMAEAIGLSLAQPRFHFASAGVEPKPVPLPAAAFMRSRQLDVSHMAPKAITEVPNLEHYRVVVALSAEARQAFPAKPHKTVVLEWNLKDPTAVVGTAAEVTAAYEEAYDYLQDRIHDLMSAILGDEINQTKR